MTKVTLENCNEIIAEFMGNHTYKGRVVKFDDLGREMPVSQYDESLDSLVPILNKYNLVPSYDKMGDNWSCEMWQGSTLGKNYENAVSKKIEEATALALAKAIMDISNES